MYTFTGHIRGVNTLAITPDGRKVVSSSYNDSTIKIWDIDTGREFHTITQDVIYRLLITLDGTKIVCSGYNDSTIKIWDIDTAKELFAFSVSSHLLSEITPDGKKLVSAGNPVDNLYGGGDDSTIKVWDIQTGRQLRSHTLNSNKVMGIAITSDGTKIVSISDDSTVKVWDMETGVELRSLIGCSSTLGGLPIIAITPDKRKIVFNSYDLYNTIKVQDINTGKYLITLPNESKITAIVISPDSKKLIAGDEAGRLHFLELIV